MKDNLGDRMKNNYENRYRFKLTRRIPVIMRLDGKAFHTLTKNCEKPFDLHFNNSMWWAAFGVIEEIQGAKCVYIQSDEISILITDFDKLTTDAWFDYNIQKMTSVAASIASIAFNEQFFYLEDGYKALFDCRVFNIPKEEVVNYFVWRQKDWVRNSVQMLARSYYSHKELHKKKQSDMHEMLYKKGVNWADLESKWKNGVFIYKEDRNFKTEYDFIFTEPLEREFIEEYLKGE